MKYRLDLASIILAGALVSTACGPTFDEGQDAQIRVDPARELTFSRVKLNETRTLPVMVSNVGRDPLKVSDVEWIGSTSVSLSVEGSGFPRNLDSHNQFAIGVQFSPTKTTPSPDGVIRIHSNDIDEPVYDVKVLAQQLDPQIHVVPSAEEKLVFGQVEPGKTLNRTVVITNTGDLPLDISKISLVGPKSFEYTIVGDSTLPQRLINGESRLTMNVTFSPTDTGRAEASLVIQSNDPDSSSYTLPIVANSDSPCLKIQPVILEFSPAVSVDSTAKRDVTLTSCSQVPLTISNVMKASGDNVFSYELIGADHALENGESATLRIHYSPDHVGTNKAEYVIVNDDPLQPNASVSVIGTASSNQCPTAVARARINTASEWSRNIEAAPLDTILFDGALSHDVESTELKYFWSIRKAPTDSTSKLSVSGAQASLFADLAGNYTVCLNVEDSGAMMSCSEDCISFTAIPREKLHFQLVWHTPKDETIGDKDGTDLDLHFVRLRQGADIENPTGEEHGIWGDVGDVRLQNGTDVYFENREPTWTIAGLGTEKPSLDRDDADGEGPENINMDTPVPCSWYALGVHYYQDNALGPSYATLRVYVSGKLRFEKSNISLSQTGVFKQVAVMHWDGTTAHIYETDYAYDNDAAWVHKAPILPDFAIEDAKKSAPQCFLDE